MLHLGEMMSLKREKKKTKEGRPLTLDNVMKDPRSAINLATLLDTMNALILDLDIPTLQKNINIAEFLGKYKKAMCNIGQLTVNPADFEYLKVIGKGSYGIVHLVRHKKSQKIYSMKVLNKCESACHRSSALYMEERNIMAFTDSPWILKLVYSFMDPFYLYMVMEYMPGGDLHTLLRFYKISEDRIRFYAAELVLAVDAIHSMGYIHRDLKPENILIDTNGHLKLADFGMCIKVDKRGLACFPTIVGTPQYMSPELVAARGKGGYFGKEVDWWAVGVCIYEMLVGALPFQGESRQKTFENILNYRQCLSSLNELDISENAKDLIKELLNHRDTRLGRKGAGTVMAHPFFKNDEWTFETVQNGAAPWVPELKGESDTRHFDKFKKDKSGVEIFPVPSSFVGNHLQFVGFTYFQEDKLPSTGKCDNNSTDYEEEPSTSASIRKEQEEAKDKYNQLKELQDKCSELEASKQEVEKKLGAKELENIQHLKSIFHLESHLSELEGEMRKVKQALKEGESEKKELLDKISKLEKEKTIKQIEMEYRLNELKQRLEQEMAAHKATKARLYKENKSSKDIENTIKELEQNLQEEQKPMLEYSLNQALLLLKEIRLDEEKLNKEKLADKLESIDLSSTSSGTDENPWMYQSVHSYTEESKEELEGESAPMISESSYICFKGHEFIPFFCCVLNQCRNCNRGLSNFYKFTLALVCRICHMKCHKHHVDNKEQSVEQCNGKYEHNKRLQDLKQDLEKLHSYILQMQNRLLEKKFMLECHFKQTMQKFGQLQKRTKNLSEETEYVDEKRQEEDRERMAEQSNCITFKGHEFLPILNIFAKKCKSCDKNLENYFERSQGLMCRKCHFRCLKNHIDDEEEVVEICEVTKIKLPT